MAQVAVTLAGFAGIVVVFRPDSVHQWSLLDQFRLRLLLTNSALPLADALFAIFLLTIDPAPVAIWRWCSAFSLATQIPFRISIGTAMRRLPAAERQSTNRLIYYSIGVIAAVAFVLQVMNIISWNKFWPFFAGMFVNLIAAVVQFLRLVLLPHGPK
ncbi:MAG: hypothetical protein ACJ8M1_15345 [Chthoniobacterales bacterium]